MQAFVLRRLTYWIIVVALLALKFAVIVGMMAGPQWFSTLKYVDTAVVIVLAFVVGGRFADIGWPRWLGIALVLLITIVLPIVILLTSAKPLGPVTSPIDAAPDITWITTAALGLLLLVTGIVPGKAGMPPPPEQRKEPTFR